MSTICGEEIFGIGQRLREERTRLGLSQAAFGEKIGTSDRTIKKYEGNKTSPRASELFVAYSFGVDVLYVITGQREGIFLAQDRAEFLSPAKLVAIAIADLSLTDDDAKIILLLANRLALKSK